MGPAPLNSGMGTNRPNLTVPRILRWADTHHERTGRWPTAASGPVTGAPGETWPAINLALDCGWRGLPGGDSLARLLVRRGRRPALWSGGRWTAALDHLLRTLTLADAARRTGRPLKAVYQRRYKLRLPDARKERGRGTHSGPRRGD
jgi:hypothetical protein